MEVVEAVEAVHLHAFSVTCARVRAPEQTSAPPPASDSPPTTNSPMTIHHTCDTRAASCASTLTFRLPSAFITTADQWPFSTGQLTVCVPEPVA